MPTMRTTLTLDRDVAERLEREIHRTGKGMKATVNEALRVGLGIAGKPVKPPPFKVKAYSLGLKPGFDRDKMNQLVDDLEAEEVARKMRDGLA